MLDTFCCFPLPVPGGKWLQSSERSPFSAALTPELAFPLCSGHRCELDLDSCSLLLLFLGLNKMLLLQVRQNCSSPTCLSFGDHIMHPKHLAAKFVQVMHNYRYYDTSFDNLSLELLKALFFPSPLDGPYNVETGCS